MWAERVRGPGRPSSARRAAPRSRLEWNCGRLETRNQIATGNRLDSIHQLVLLARKKKKRLSLPFSFYVSRQRRKLLFDKRAGTVLFKRSQQANERVLHRTSPGLCRCLEKVIVFHTSFKPAGASERSYLYSSGHKMFCSYQSWAVDLFVLWPLPVLYHASARTHVTVKLRLRGCRIIISFGDGEPWALLYTNEPCRVLFLPTLNYLK